MGVAYGSRDGVGRTQGSVGLGALIHGAVNVGEQKNRQVRHFATNLGGQSQHEVRRQRGIQQQHLRCLLLNLAQGPVNIPHVHR